MALGVELAKRLPSQENLLLDYVRRLDQHKAGRRAVHIRLSGLLPINRRDHHVRAAASNFEALARQLQGQLFVLGNADLFFIYREQAHPQAEGAVQKVRYLFSDDPLLDGGATADDGGFVTWYDVTLDFDAILRLVQGLADDGDDGRSPRRRVDTRAALKARQEQGAPLTPDILGRIEGALERADLSSLVRRQSVCGVNGKMVPRPVFSEIFISIPDLRETVVPGVNLTSNRWLFQHLTQTLDRRMLAMLGRVDAATMTGDISINLNVSTVLSPEFLAFDESLTASRRGAIIIELQKMDVLADPGAYLFAREFAREKGYRIGIDGLTHRTMAMVDRTRMGVDLVKLVWHPDMADSGEDGVRRIAALVADAGEARVVLCRVDSREAVDFGHAVGIALFQGRYVETLIAEDRRRRELLHLKQRVERNT